MPTTSKNSAPRAIPPEEIYLPALENGVPVLAVAIRTKADPSSAAASLRREIRSIDPEIAVNEITTLDDARDDSIRVHRISTDLLSLFAVAALAIAVSGVGGILALSITRRGREIAIRMVLGAEPGSVLRMLIAQGMKQVVIGLALGIAGALLLTKALRELLFEIRPTDPATFIGVSLLLIVTALGACFIPARRATRIEPSVALRSE